jgi:multicomponent Na+:H+ antiporter subunit E
VNLLLLNVLLALAWGALVGQFDPLNLLFGFLLGYITLWITTRDLVPAYFRKVPMALAFLGFFLWELLQANLRVALTVLSPHPKERLHPAIVAVPLDLRSPAQITLLANLLTLTPGTLSVDVSDDRRVLFIHTLYMKTPESFRREIKEGFERRVKELFA